jgi:hypothetical protein
MNQKQRTVLDNLLQLASQTYAAEAGIRLADKPAPLYRLLVLSVLLSTRIKAGIAVTAIRELFQAGLRTPRKMAESRWQDRVDALGRAHYRRYDEQTATALGDGAQLLLDDYSGDVRMLRERANRKPAGIRRALTALPRIGPTGADILCREAQDLWTELRPYFDKKTLQGAEKLGLPTKPRDLAELATGTDLATVAAALVRADLDKKLSARAAN